MENRNTIFAVLAALGIVVLGGYMLVSVFINRGGSALPPETPAAPQAVFATALNTFTPTPTDTPFIFVTPTPMPPTITPTPLPTATATASNTPTPLPSQPIVRIATRTPTPIPTNTPVVISYPYKVDGGPAVDPNHRCENQYTVAGYVRDSEGQGIPNVLLRYIPKYGFVELPGRTRTGSQAGYYELTLGINGNDWDIYLVDANDNPISPSVHVTTSDFGKGNCWWQLNWKRN